MYSWSAIVTYKSCQLRDFEHSSEGTTEAPLSSITCCPYIFKKFFDEELVKNDAEKQYSTKSPYVTVKAALPADDTIFVPSYFT